MHHTPTTYLSAWGAARFLAGTVACLIAGVAPVAAAATGLPTVQELIDAQKLPPAVEAEATTERGADGIAFRTDGVVAWDAARTRQWIDAGEGWRTLTEASDVGGEYLSLSPRGAGMGYRLESLIKQSGGQLGGERALSPIGALRPLRADADRAVVERSDDAVAVELDRNRWVFDAETHRLLRVVVLSNDEPLLTFHYRHWAPLAVGAGPEEFMHPTVVRRITHRHNRNNSDTPAERVFNLTVTALSGSQRIQPIDFPDQAYILDSIRGDHFYGDGTRVPEELRLFDEEGRPQAPPAAVHSSHGWLPQGRGWVFGVVLGGVLILAGIVVRIRRAA